MQLKGSVAIVTGGGTGIGRTVAEQLAHAGAAAVVIGYAHSAQDANTTAEQLRQLGCVGRAVQADIADADAVPKLVDTALQEHGRVDALVNSAGTTRSIPFQDLDALTEEVWDEVWRVNLLGTFYACRAAAPALRAAGGAIVNIGSIAGERAVGSSIPYGVTKAAVSQLTRSLALALAPDVRVNAVAPGHVTGTRWHRDLIGPERAAEVARANAGREPMGRVARPEDVAQMVLALLRSDLVTGQTLIVDGGTHALY